jgi:hypothetical protein
MSDAHKVPLARTLPQFARGQARVELGKIGLRLPGHVVAVSGPIVTVNFDVEGIQIQQMTMAAAMSKYCRSPIQVGDLGYATTADAYLGAVTGLGAGTADMTQRGNLSCLVWVPLGNKNWSAVDSTSMHLESANGQFTVDVANGGITMAYEGTTLFQINSSGQVIINGRVFMNHDHGPGAYVAGSTPVTGNSGTVI